MIVENQKNIKVHFAGAEQTDFSYLLAVGGGVKYLLFSVFYYISNCLNIKSGGFWKGIEVYKEFNYFNTEHSIMDSGLFTLMFGAHRGKRNEREIEIWYENLINYVKINKIKSTCVEIDCQKILGISKAWELRKRMKNDLQNRQINVFHKEDGQKGLDEMIEFSDYIAISVPELRFIGQKNDTLKIAHYIKNKKPDIDIHLLGCTDLKMIKSLNFCSSCDSTSWQQINRFGSLTNNCNKKNINKDSVTQKYGKVVEDMVNRYNKKITDANYYYYSCYVLASKYYKELYTKTCGNQN